MEEKLFMVRVRSLWSAKLSATTGVLNINILHAFVCVCVCLCMRASWWKPSVLLLLILTEMDSHFIISQ